MDKNAIKKYAIWARRELIDRVTKRAAVFGVSKEDVGDPNADSVNGHLLSDAEKRQRQALIRRIEEKGYEQVMEEVAYTWFNRFAALRFMEVNGYLPTHIRVFTDDEGHFRPQILSEAIHLDLDGLNKPKVYQLKDSNQEEELFKYLLIVQCNALNGILPGMFQKIEDYTELLLPDYLLREGSVIEQMVTLIPEDDWKDQVQIIGWLYQYYNTEPKDKVFADLKKNIKISKENIPAATQLFTPDWIVHYMVENSLGRLWLEGHPSARDITASSFSIRYSEVGFVNNDASMAVYEGTADFFAIIGLLNSKVAQHYLSLVNESLNYTTGNVSSVPYVERDTPNIRSLVEHCIEISKADWDSFETSWDFKEHPLIRWSRCLGDATSIGATIQYYYGRRMPVSCPLELCYLLWQGECNKRFEELKSNEEELNRIFIDIYGLQDELTPDVDDKDVTVRKADLSRDIRSLISYAVGCMVGRYSLDKPGLAFAGGAWNASQYVTYPADKDGILPITDDEYFADDIVTMFVNWLKTVYGADTLEENLRFISDALGGKGSPREVIRNYFLNDFYKDHLKVYQKRPIYWLFDSGKKNGFKALVYMHRYQPDTIARVRTDYVHEMQSRYRTAIADVEQRLNDASTSERVKLTKRLNALQAQADELRQYEEKIHHLADQMIAIDLDDGVKVNYAKFADVLATIK